MSYINAFLELTRGKDTGKTGKTLTCVPPGCGKRTDTYPKAPAKPAKPREPGEDDDRPTDPEWLRRLNALMGREVPPELEPLR